MHPKNITAIAALLETGKTPWSALVGAPFNPTTSSAYKGANRIVLMCTNGGNAFATKNQVQKAGLAVVKTAKPAAFGTIPKPNGFFQTFALFDVAASVPGYEHTPRVFDAETTIEALARKGEVVAGDVNALVQPGVISLNSESPTAFAKVLGDLAHAEVVEVEGIAPECIPLVTSIVTAAMCGAHAIKSPRASKAEAKTWAEPFANRANEIARWTDAALRSYYGVGQAAS